MAVLYALCIQPVHTGLYALCTQPQPQCVCFVYTLCTHCVCTEYINTYIQLSFLSCMHFIHNLYTQPCCLMHALCTQLKYAITLFELYALCTQPGVSCKHCVHITMLFVLYPLCRIHTTMLFVLYALFTKPIYALFVCMHVYKTNTYNYVVCLVCTVNTLCMFYIYPLTRKNLKYLTN